MFTTSHVSGVTCHMSRVTCQMSRVRKSGEASHGRVCYQRGLPRLVLLNISVEKEAEKRHKHTPYTGNTLVEVDGGWKKMSGQCLDNLNTMLCVVKNKILLFCNN